MNVIWKKKGNQSQYNSSCCEMISIRTACDVVRAYFFNVSKNPIDGIFDIFDIDINKNVPLEETLERQDVLLAIQKLPLNIIVVGNSASLNHIREMDKILNKRGYDDKNLMYNKYLDSMYELRKISKEFGEFPTVEEWNRYAKENMLLNSESIKYISGLDWNKLRDRIKKDLNKKK